MDIKQLEPLKEVATIGAGNGATAISKFLKIEVKFEVPELALLEVEKVGAKIGRNDGLATVIHSKLTGDLSGVVLLLFDPETSSRIGDLLTKKPDLKKSALNELGNIFLGNALKAVTEFLEMHISYSGPSSETDMLGALVDPVISKLGEKSEKVLLIDANFSISGLDFKAVFLTDPKSTAIVLDRLNDQLTKKNGTRNH